MPRPRLLERRSAAHTVIFGQAGTILPAVGSFLDALELNRPEA